MIIEIFTLALILWGISALFDEGMILGQVGIWLESKLPVKLLKPIIYCPACMSSVWGTAWALYYNYPVENWLILVFGVCGLNFIIMKHLSR